MSHLSSEGREGIAAYPKQKTLSNFLVAKDALESTISDDIHQPSESIDFPDTYHIPDCDKMDPRHFHNEGDTQQEDNLNEYVSDQDPVRDSCSGSLEESNRDQRKTSSSDNEPASSPSPKEPIFWLNDCQCFVCDFDFHLAERLQDEESSSIN